MNDRFFLSGYNAKEYRSTHRYYVQETKDEVELKKIEQQLAVQHAVDVSVIKNIAKLRAFESFFTDDEKVYRVEYNINGEQKKFTVVQNLSPKAIFYPCIASYQHETSDFFDDESVIKFVFDQDGKILKSIPHQSKLKSLGIAYLFDDKMLIQNDVINSPLDFETAVLHESFVDVINGSSDAELSPIEVEYRHYFKDKNGIYLYKTGSKKLEKM